MTLRNKQYGKPKLCEKENCTNKRGSSLHSIYSYGCVICVNCENEYQLGNITLPKTANQTRKEKATNKILS